MQTDLYHLGESSGYGQWRKKNQEMALHFFPDLLKYRILFSIVLGFCTAYQIFEPISHSQEGSVSMTSSYLINAWVRLVFYVFSGFLCLKEKIALYGKNRCFRKDSTNKSCVSANSLWPTWWIGDGSMEAAKIDQRVGAEVEVWDDWSDGVQLGW